MDAAAISRPYAAAIFAIAREQKAIDVWHNALTQMSNALAEVEKIAAGRLLDSSIKAEVLLKSVKDDMQKRFISLLAKNGRLETLPFITERFDFLRLEDAGIVRATVESAVEISDKKEFNKLLEKRFGKQVEASYEEVPALLGGVRVYVRDDVLDASLLGRLNKLSAALA